MSKGSFSPNLFFECHFSVYKIQNNTVCNSMGSDHYQWETCLSLSPSFFLALGGSSWCAARDPMTHRCKGDKPAAVWHLPWLMPALLCTGSIISRNNLLGVWSGPDEIKMGTEGDVLVDSLLHWWGCPGWGLIFPQLVTGQIWIQFVFSLPSSHNFITKVTCTIRVCH